MRKIDQENSLNIDYTEKTRHWLDYHYKRDENGIYSAHRPIYGFGIKPSQKNHTIRYGISYGILKMLNRLDWNTLIDVGGGEGYIAKLAREIFGKEAFSSEISLEANLRSREYFGLHGITADIHRLPFKDESFDIVLASEVIEHLQFPSIGLYEMARVAKKAIILTTAEAYATEKERRLRLKTRNFEAMHGERNYWLPDDFKKIFKNDVKILTCTRAFMDIDENLISGEEAKNLVKDIAPLNKYDGNGLDAMIIVLKDDSVMNEPLLNEFEILDKLFDFKVDKNYRSEERILFPIDALCCPVCKQKIDSDIEKYICANCGEEYECPDEIPFLISKQALSPISESKISKVGINNDGLQFIDKIFRPDDKAPSDILKFTSTLFLILNLLVRFVKSDVPLTIRFKWFRNKFGVSTIKNYFFK